MHLIRSLSILGSSVVVVAALSGCGPSPVARNPPPADPGTASLRTTEDPDVVVFPGPISCINGLAAERSRSRTSIYCSIDAPDAVRHHVEILLEMGSTLSLAEGTELSTLSEIRLERAGGGSRSGHTVAAETASWDGAVTVTLGPPGSPRTAVLDGALSSVFTPSMAMTFNAVPIVIE